MPIGRPTKYPKSKKKREALFNALIEHGKTGLSFETFGASDGCIEAIGSRVVKDTLYNWLKLYPDFSDAKKEFEAESRTFWEKIATDHLTHYKDGKQLNSTVWIFNMKNRFGWRDKIDVEEKQTSDVNVEISFSKKTEPDTE